MKHLKRIASVLLAMIMVLALGVTAFATEPEGDNDSNAGTGSAEVNHTYEIYQIFTGDYSDGALKSDTIKWGKNGTGTMGEKVAEDVLNALEAVLDENDKEQLEVIEQYVNLKSDPIRTGAETTYSGLTPGYYLVKDKDGSLEGTNEGYTLYVVQVISDTLSFTPKKVNVPTPGKEVLDKNDSENTDSTTDWGNSADYDIGDEVSYRLSAILPDSVSSYKTYKLVFHDKLSDGLDYKDTNEEAPVVSIIKKGQTEPQVITGGYTCAVEGKEMTITFDDVKAAPVSAEDGDIITVEYKAILNENAKKGTEGNTNDMYLEYSNNPNDDGEGTGKTPPVTAIVFTFDTVVNKVDQDGNALKGAAFELKKLVKRSNGTEEWQTVGEIGKGEAIDKFTFSGLDDGRYMLTETVTPEGYNTIESIYFEITAVHGKTDNGEELTELKVVATDKDGNEIEGENPFNVTLTSGNITTDIENSSDTLLPSTGGIGTTIFYIIGGVLIVGAAVLLIARKRTSS